MARQYQKHLNNKRNWLAVFSGLTCQLLLSTPAHADAVWVGLQPFSAVACVGDTVYLQVTVGLNGYDAVSNGSVAVAFPDGHVETVMSGFSLSPTTQWQVITNISYQVQAFDLGTTVSVSNAYGCSYGIGGQTNSVSFAALVTAENGQRIKPCSPGQATITILMPVPVQITNDGTNFTLFFYAQSNTWYYGQTTYSLDSVFWRPAGTFKQSAAGVVRFGPTPMLRPQQFYRIGMIAN